MHSHEKQQFLSKFPYMEVNFGAQKMHPSYLNAVEQPGHTGVHVMNATSVFDMGVRSLHSLVLHFLTQGESAESCKVATNDAPGCGNILSDLPILEGLCPILATLHPRQTDICSSTTPS